MAEEHRLIRSRDVQLHVAVQGQGRLVLLVPGNPEARRSWRHQLPPLAAAGFTAATVAPLRPDVVRAVGLQGVRCTPPGGPRPTSVLAQERPDVVDAALLDLLERA